MKNVFIILNWTVSSKLALQAPFFPKHEELQSSTIGGESNVYVAMGLRRTNTFTLQGER
jgi:hypothetical protein